MKKLTFILLFLLTQTAFAQVEFRVEPNRTKIGLNEELRVEFIMNVDDNDTFRAPNFERFKLKSENPKRRIEKSIKNGLGSLKVIYSYRLEPTEKGVFYIGSATISKDGKIYKTESLQIEVTDPVGNPNQPKNVEVEVYLIAEANRTEVYEKELLVVNYKVLFNKEIDVNRLGYKDSINYTDFVKYVVYPKEDTTKKEEIYTGKTFHKIEFDKMYFFPVKSGKLTLSPLEFDAELLVPSEKKDFWGRTIFDKVTKTIKTNPINIEVKPLPEERKYEFFYGLVGDYIFIQNFKIQTPLKLGETFDIEIIVEGTGNQLVSPMPKPNLSEGLEIIEIKKEEPVFFSDKPDYLLKTIYTIKPKYVGEHSVNKITYAYFNPVIEEYIYDTKNEQIITVIE